MNNKVYDVFLSYSRADNKEENDRKIEKIYEKLRDSGISTFFDTNEDVGGTHWEPNVKEAIQKAKFFIPIFSKDMVKSEGYVHEEIKLALEIYKKQPLGEIRIIPIKLDNCEIPYPVLKKISYINLFSEFEVGVSKLIDSIWTHKANDDIEIIGFDIGHGESAISITKINSKDSPDIIPIEGKRQTIITAVAISPDGIVIGDEAFKSENSTDLSILFKGSNLKNSNVYKPLKLFVEECLDIVRRQKKARLDENTCFLVGCPSGWKEKTIKEYENLLRQAGMSNVVVKAESRAAFLDARQHGYLGKASNQLIKNVLIIDIGSSTTDFTVVKNYTESPIDFGDCDLGAGLLDKLIYTKAINSCECNDKKLIKDILSQDKILESKCILKCRNVKEEYFNKIKTNPKAWKNKSASNEQRILKNKKERLYLDIEINEKDMNEILRTPIESLENKSWIQAFRDLLKRCQLHEKYETPNLVLMTGGGSEMNFTHEICKKEFPTSKIIVTPNPGLTIAKGLALTGQIDFKIRKFLVEIDNLIESKELKDIIKQEITVLIQSITKTLTNKFIEITTDYFHEWLEGKIGTIKELETTINKKAEDLFNNEGKKIIEQDIEQWIKKISKKIESLTQQICCKYSIPPTSFNLSVSPENAFKHIYTNVDLIDKTTDNARFIAHIASGVLITLISGIIFSVLSFGFFGVIFGIIAGIFGAEEVRKIYEWNKPLREAIDQAIEEGAKSLILPTLIRPFLSQENFTKELNNKRSELEKDIGKKLNEEFRSKQTEIYESIQKPLYKRAGEAALLIRRSK